MLRCWVCCGCRSCVVRLDWRGELDEGRLEPISMGETVLGMAMRGSCGEAALNSGSWSSSSSSGKSKSSEVNSSARVLV